MKTSNFHYEYNKKNVNILYIGNKSAVLATNPITVIDYKNGYLISIANSVKEAIDIVNARFEKDETTVYGLKELTPEITAEKVVENKKEKPAKKKPRRRKKRK